MPRPVAIIGLDCVPPALLFERWAGCLPHLQGLLRHGVWGVLRSCDPPITVPAWQVMVTGRDPGELGLYGFRNRRSAAYGDVGLADSSCVTYPRLWDWLGQAGRRSIVLGVPLTYPPPAVRGSLVSCFMTPSRRSEYTFPRRLQNEIETEFPDYEHDVGEFRTADRAALLARLYRKTENQFGLARYLLRREPWDFFMMVEMGPDRLHHAFWQPAGADDVMLAYYRFLDDRVGELLQALPSDALVIVVSDHGAQSMQGGFRLNQWLIDRGDLCLKEPPVVRGPLRPEMVDWAHTRAWADGGYCGRIFVNRRGREPQGIVDGEYDAFVQELIDAFEALSDEHGQPLGNRAFRPRDRFAAVEKLAPDLLLYGGGLAWRMLGKVGYDDLWTRDNDSGPDCANHHPDGVFLLSDRNPMRPSQQIDGLDLLDVTPTVLRACDVPVPSGLRGRAVALPALSTGEAHA